VQTKKKERRCEVKEENVSMHLVQGIHIVVCLGVARHVKHEAHVQSVTI